jgi:hypothetical protein
MYNLMQLILVSSSILKECSKIFGIYMFWSLTHILCVELFYRYCNPKSFYEYFFVPLYNETPHCKILSWIQTKSRDTSYSISATILTWASKYIVSNLKIS